MDREKGRQGGTRKGRGTMGGRTWQDQGKGSSFSRR